jgi:Flp pilus assembly protein TadD
MEPRNARAMAGLVRLHMARRDGRAAAQWARRLAAARPTQSSNHVLLGDALLLAGDRAAARAAWERALQIAPSDRDARRRLAR